MDTESGLPWVIELRIPSVPSVAKLKVSDRAVIGRTDKTKEVIPDLDLTPWGAMELGVAPEHVVVIVKDDELYIQDLGAGRPTLLNGARLDDELHRLQHGDDIQLGVLHLQVNVVASPNQGSIIHQQHGITIAEDVTPGNGQTILVVEDDPETAEIFKLIMERAGFSVHTCREVVSAIRLLNSETPSAILLDLMLPDIHGLELCRYVRRDIEQSDIPIIIVSAAITKATIAQSMDVGADVFLGKPVSMKELVRVVSSLVTWYESKKPSIQTRRLVGTAQLDAMPNEVRRDALVFFVSGYQEPIAVVVPSRITIGRRGGNTARRPHVDLEKYGAFDAGVSRTHATIYREDDGFYIEDLNSRNGTFINNIQIEPEKRYPLTNASEISFGSLHTRVFFFTEDDEKLILEDPSTDT